MVPEETGIPDQIRPSYARLKPHAAYLLENGREIVVWFGSKVSPSVIQKLVGAPAFQSIDTKLVKLPQTQDPLNIRLNRLVAYIRAKRHVYMPVSDFPPHLKASDSRRHDDPPFSRTLTTVVLLVVAALDF
jgi:protein transport protein SEC24